MIDALVSVPAARHVVVAGEMLELGPAGESLHDECGRFMALKGVKCLIGVRGLAEAMVRAAAAEGVDAVFVASPEEAGERIAAELREGDAVLMKASRGVRLERALEILKSRKDTSADAPLSLPWTLAGDHAIVVSVRRFIGRARTAGSPARAVVARAGAIEARRNIALLAFLRTGVPAF